MLRLIGLLTLPLRIFFNLLKLPLTIAGCITKIVFLLMFIVIIAIVVVVLVVL